MKQFLPIITATTELDPSIGFHPKILYKLQVDNLKEHGKLRNKYSMKWSSSPLVPFTPCQEKTTTSQPVLILSQTLPADTFVDPYQLENLVSFHEAAHRESRVFPVLDPSTQIELELPVYEIPETFENTFHIFWDLGQAPSNEANFTLPVHMRYRKPYDGLKQKINFPPPSIRVGCFEGSLSSNSFL